MSDIYVPPPLSINITSSTTTQYRHYQLHHFMLLQNCRVREKHCLSPSLFSSVTDGDLRGRNFLQINNFGYVIAHYSSSIIKSAPLQCKLKLLRLAKYIMLQAEVQFLTLTRMCAYQEQQWQRILSRQSASSRRGSRIRSRASVSEVMTLWKGFQQCFWAST